MVAYALGQGIPARSATDFRDVPGQGVTATVDGHRVAVGNRRLVESLGIDLATVGPIHDEFADTGQTAVFAAVDAQVAAVILPGDKAAQIASLQASGRVIVMVGDGVNDPPALARQTRGSPSGQAPTSPSTPLTSS